MGLETRKVIAGLFVALLSLSFIAPASADLAAPMEFDDTSYGVTSIAISDNFNGAYAFNTSGDHAGTVIEDNPSETSGLAYIVDSNDTVSMVNEQGDVQGSFELGTSVTPATEFPSSIDVRDDGNRFIASTSAGNTKIWNTSDKSSVGTPIQSWIHEGPVSFGGSATVYNMSDGKWSVTDYDGNPISTVDTVIGSNPNYRDWAVDEDERGLWLIDENNIGQYTGFQNGTLNIWNDTHPLETYPRVDYAGEYVLASGYDGTDQRLIVYNRSTSSSTVEASVELDTVTTVGSLRSMAAKSLTNEGTSVRVMLGDFDGRFIVLDVIPDGSGGVNVNHVYTHDYGNDNIRGMAVQKGVEDEEEGPEPPTFNLFDPGVNQQNFTTNDITYDYAVSSSSNGTVELVTDGTNELTHFHNGSGVIGWNDVVNEPDGDHTWRVDFIRDSDGQEFSSSTQDYTILEDTSVVIDAVFPEDGDVIETDEQVAEADVDANIPGITRLYIDGSLVGSCVHAGSGTERCSEPFNTSVGTHTFTPKYESDNDGWFNGTTQTFDIVSDTSGDPITRIELNNPEDGLSTVPRPIEFDFDVWSESPGYYQLVVDGQIQAVDGSTKNQVDSGEWSNVSETIPQPDDFGQRDWYVNFTYDPQNFSTASETRTFTLTNESASITLEEPADGADLGRVKEVRHEAHAYIHRQGTRKVNNDTGEVDYTAHLEMYVNGEQVYQRGIYTSGRQNISVDVPASNLVEGQNEWYVIYDKPNDATISDTRTYEATPDEDHIVDPELQPVAGFFLTGVFTFLGGIAASTPIGLALGLISTVYFVWIAWFPWWVGVFLTFTVGYIMLKTASGLFGLEG